MKINSGRPIRALTATEQDGLLEMLFPAKQTEVFTQNRTINSLLGSLLESLQSDTNEKPRELTQGEKDVAERVFGDMIDLGEVRVGDKNWLAQVLHSNQLAMTICNTIYGMEIPDDTLIHELVHVWQYDKEHIDLASAALPHIRVLIGIRTTEELYDYSVDDIEDKDRRTFRDYGFEQQAAIVQDAYLVTEEEHPPQRNKDYKSGDPLPKELYERFMQDFREWHEELTGTEQVNRERIEWLKPGNPWWRL